MLEVYGPHDPKTEMHNAHKARIARLKAAGERREAQIAAEIAADDAIENKRQLEILEACFVEEVMTIEPWYHTAPPVPLPEGAAPRLPRIDEIQRSTANHYGVSRIDMVSARRTANVVRPRQVAMYLSKTMTLRSFPEIGRRFGGRDHTTVLHAVRKIGALVEHDADLAATVDAIKAGLAA